MNKKTYQLLLFLLGIFYLFSGIIKIIDIDNFLYLIRSYHIKLFIYFAPIIPVVEITVGILMIFRKRVKEIVLFSILLLIFFTGMFAYGHFAHRISDCGCFGGIDFLKMSPAVFFLRNGLLISFSLFLYYSPIKVKNDTNFRLPHVFIIALVILISVFFVGTRTHIKDYLKERPYTRTNIDQYHTNEFVNKNIHETILSKYISTSQDSTYLIFIFSYKCPHCLSSSIKLNNYLKNDGIDRVIGLTKGTRGEKRFFEKVIKPQFDYKSIRHIEMSEITAFFPLSFYIENDTIRYKIRGGLPDYNKFEDLYLNK